jgi:peptidoglycan hydrolase-like protein with peptidoglycan-binding domain
MSSPDVKRLQQLLNSDPDTRVAVNGVGSPGNETNYFGALTEVAVQKFQLKYGVVASPNDPGYGYVGPKTGAKLAEVFSAAAPSVTQNVNQQISSQQAQLSTEEIERQIQEALKQLEALQAELNATLQNQQ